MGISKENYKKAWDLHAWAGVIVGLLAAVMFGTGAAVVFQGEIETWQDRLAQKPAPAPDYERWSEVAEDAFESTPPRQFTLWFPDGDRGYPRVGYFSGETGRYRMEWIDPDEREVIPQREKLGTLLFHIHTFYDVRFPSLYDFAGIVALVLVLVIVTGVVIQWHNLVAQFHQFRVDARPMVRWNDLHKVIGVTTLPFQLFFAYSAAIIVLAPFFVDAVVDPVFGGDRAAAKAGMYGRLPLPEASEKDSTGETYRSMDTLVETAEHRVEGLDANKIMFRNWRRSNPRADIEGPVEGDRFGHAIVRLDPTTGEVTRIARPSQQTWAAKLRGWIAEIHSVNFGGFWTRLLLALLSLAAAASMLAGIVVWFARRRRQRDAFVDHVLEKLTAGVGTGIVVAMATSFAASRLLPWHMPGRLGAQELTYYLAFSACIVAAFFASKIRRFWCVQLSIAGLLFGVTPLLTAPRSTAGVVGMLTSSSTETVPAVIGVDIGLIVVGVALVGSAWALGRSASSAGEKAESAPS